MERKQTKALYVGVESLSKEGFSTHEYAQSCELYGTLSEATKIFVRKVKRFLDTEWTQQFAGQHVLLKSFSSFGKIVINKLCFLYNFIKIFQVESNVRNGLDYHQLFRLLCSDFPKQIVQKSVAVLLPMQDSSSNMYKSVNSKRFINSLYVNFLYSEYIDNMQRSLFGQDINKVVQFIDIYAWIKLNETRSIKSFEKPSFGIMMQIIVTLMRRKNLLGHEGSLIFVTEQNIEEFIRQKTSLSQDGINFKLLLSELVDSPQHVKIVQQNLDMFENTQVWANQAYKLLSVKEISQTPLNVKKNTKPIKK